MWIILPLTQAGTALHQEVCPEPMVPPVRKESLWWTSSSPSNVGGFLGALRGLQGKMRGSTTENQIVMEKGEELTTTSNRIVTQFLPQHPSSSTSAAAALFICRAKMA